MISNRFLKMTGALCLRLFRIIRALSRGLWRWIVLPSLIFISLYYTCSFLFSEMMTRNFEFNDKDQAAIYGMTPNEYREIRFMEIEEYLRELRYYDGPLTGKVTLGFLSAVYDFSKDQKIPNNAPILSQEIYRALRERYWLALGVWRVPYTSSFYADDIRIIAQGGWENQPSQTLVPHVTSIIWCIMEKGVCTEEQKIDFHDIAYMPLTKLEAQPFPQSDVSIKYRIIKKDKDQIIAEMVPSADDSRDEGLEKRRWADNAGQGKSYLNINILAHTVMKTIVTKKSSNTGTNSDESRHERKLVDPAERLFAIKFETMRKRRVLNNAEGERYDRLLQWMKLRDLSEYKKLRAGRNNNFLLSDLPQNTTFSFLDAGD